jgi:ribonuclease P protein component
VRHATHVRKRAEFERIQSAGSRVNTDAFVLIVAAQADVRALPRLGITASRRVGNAIVRNRAKRLVRAAFRATSELFPRGIDVVVIVRRSLGERKLDSVIAEWRGAKVAIAKRVSGVLAAASKAPTDPAPRAT